jgi:hypothetical protein
MTFQARKSKPRRTVRSCKNSFHTVAKKILGYQKRPKDQWLSDQTWDLIRERKLIKQILLQSQTPSHLILKKYMLLQSLNKEHKE